MSVYQHHSSSSSDHFEQQGPFPSLALSSEFDEEMYPVMSSAAVGDADHFDFTLFEPLPGFDLHDDDEPLPEILHYAVDDHHSPSLSEEEEKMLQEICNDDDDDDYQRPTTTMLLDDDDACASIASAAAGSLFHPITLQPFPQLKHSPTPSLLSADSTNSMPVEIQFYSTPSCSRSPSPVSPPNTSTNNQLQQQQQQPVVVEKSPKTKSNKKKSAPVKKKAKGLPLPTSPTLSLHFFPSLMMDTAAAQQEPSLPVSAAASVTDESGSSDDSSDESTMACDESPTSSTAQPSAISDNKSSSTTIIPNDNDVLCGKGGRTLLHNRHFTVLCTRFADEYSKTTKRGMNGKKGIALTIVKEIKASQGRFLKEISQDLWEEIADDKASNKVAHCIRDLVRRIKQ